MITWTFEHGRYRACTHRCGSFESVSLSVDGKSVSTANGDTYRDALMWILMDERKHGDADAARFMIRAIDAYDREHK